MDPFETLAIDLLAQGHSIRFRAAGSSMRPFILDGDSVEIQPVGQNRFRAGDIVLYRLPSGRPLLHRVMRVRGAKILVQGDAMLSPDGWMDAGQVLGKARAVYRRGNRQSLVAIWPVFLGLLWVLLSPVRVKVQPWLQRIWRGLRIRMSHP